MVILPLRNQCLVTINDYDVITTSRGTEEHYGLQGEVDIINSTLGKALGGASGGYTTGPQEVIDLLRQRSRPYLFSNSLPPPVVAGAIKVGCVCGGGELGGEGKCGKGRKTSNCILLRCLIY